MPTRKPRKPRKPTTNQEAAIFARNLRRALKPLAPSLAEVAKLIRPNDDPKKRPFYRWLVRVTTKGMTRTKGGRSDEYLQAIRRKTRIEPTSLWLEITEEEIYAAKVKQILLSAGPMEADRIKDIIDRGFPDEPADAYAEKVRQLLRRVAPSEAQRIMEIIDRDFTEPKRKPPVTRSDDKDDGDSFEGYGRRFGKK